MRYSKFYLKKKKLFYDFSFTIRRKKKVIARSIILRGQSGARFTKGKGGGDLLYASYVGHGSFAENENASSGRDVTWKVEKFFSRIYHALFRAWKRDT